MSRARSALSMLGPFGFISGLAGYTCFRSFDSFSSEAMNTDHNRRSIVSGLLTPILPYILLGTVLTNALILLTLVKEVNLLKLHSKKCNINYVINYYGINTSN